MKTTEELLKKLSVEKLSQIADNENTKKYLLEKFKITEDIRNNNEKLYDLYIDLIITLICEDANNEYLHAYEMDLYDTIQKYADFALSYDEDAINDAIMSGERNRGFLTTCVTLENTSERVTDAVDMWCAKYDIDTEDLYEAICALFDDDDFMDIVEMRKEMIFDELNCKDDCFATKHHLFYSAEDAIKHKFFLDDIMGRETLELPEDWLAVFKKHKE